MTNFVLPLVVDWQVTACCTRHCSYCYGPRDVKSLSTGDALDLVGVLKILGTRIVGVTGGEPLTLADLPRILRRIKKLGMAVCLSTNCDLYEERRSDICSLVDSLGLPIDGKSAANHDALRGRGSFKRIIATLNREATNPNMRFRIGTVVTNQNYLDIPGIAALLSPFAVSIVYWKLYDLIQYSPQRETNTLEMASAHAVHSQVEKIGNIFPLEKIVYDTRSMRHRSYLLIKPNADVFLPVLTEGMERERILGNLLTDPDQTIKAWSQEVDEFGYSECIRCIYRQDDFLAKKFFYKGYENGK